MLRGMQKTSIVFPVPANLVDRLLSETKDVFVKYTGGRSTILSLTRGSKIVFYASRGKREIVGEGIVREIEYLTPDEAVDKYGKRLFLSKKELSRYVRNRLTRDSSKKMLVVVLSHVKKYREGIHYPRPMTMSGKYLRSEEYAALMKSV